MIKSTALKRIASASCAAILAVVFSFSSAAATQYESAPSTAMSFLHNGKYVEYTWDAYYNSSTELYTIISSVPLSQYGILMSYKYALGSAFDLSGLDQYANYQYTLSLVPSAANQIDVSSPAEYGLFYTMTESTGDPMVASSTIIAAEPEITVNENGVYTFTFSGLDYSDFANAFLIYMQTGFDNLTPYSSSVSGELYFEINLLNVYFGLESAFDEEIYNKAVSDKLDSIESQLQENNEKLGDVAGAVDGVGDKVDDVKDSVDGVGDKVDDVKDSVNGVGDKVDDAADQISGNLDELQQEIENQPQAEMDKAKEEGDKASGDADDALSGSGLTPDTASLWTGLSTLFDCVRSTATVSYIPIPEVKLPSLSVGGSKTPETVLIEEQQYDISQILQNKSIQKLISAAKVLYYIFFVIFIIDYCRKLLAKIGLTDVDTHDNHTSSGQDPSASKSDPHGLKMR